MQANRILPDLQCSLVCEEVRQEVTGNFFIIGVIDTIRVPQVPITALQLCIFNRWAAGVGQFVETVRLLAPDQNTVVRRNERKFAMKDPSFNVTTVTLMANVTFATPGTYHVEVMVDDVMKIRYPVNVFVVTPPGGAPGAPPQPQPEPPPAA